MKTARREFIVGGLAAVALGGRGAAASAGTEAIKAVLLHLGNNMWCEWLPQDVMDKLGPTWKNKPDLKLGVKDELWRRVTERAAAKGMNMVVVDIGEALSFPSHPELGIEGSWSADKLRDEVKRLKRMGLEPIPKLNFSATHDGWLKDYHRMLTLPKWYEVAKDVINDVIDIFEKPRFFHLGWDEEMTLFAPGRDYFVMRAGEMWWHDFLFTVKCVEDRGVRAWVWSDKGWNDPSYYTRCPKSVIQSNWYYDEYLGGFDEKDYKSDQHLERLRQYRQLEETGFDQIPCGTHWVGHARKVRKCGADDVIGKLVKLCRETVSDRHRLGFMMAPWSMCDTEENAAIGMRGIDLFADALEGRIHPAGAFRRW